MHASIKSVRKLLGLQKGRPPLPRIRLDMSDTVVYAVGDVHGCLDALMALERNIALDAAGLPGRKLIIMLGDYIDRGASSAQVLDHLAGPAPVGIERICLAGNHELAMLDYLEGRIRLESWLRIGGEPTLLSYGIDYRRLLEVYGDERQIDGAIHDAIPDQHVAFLRSLPVLIEADRYLFVHAGIRPGVSLDQQRDEDLVFIRSAFFDNADMLDHYVVHGHTPVEEAKREGMRVNLDTGAYFSGKLTGLRIWKDKGLYLTN